MIIKFKNKKSNKIVKIVSIIILIFLSSFTIYKIYVSNYYYAEDVEDYLKSNEQVKVKKTKYGYFFDGNYNNTKIIFYPGAKIETKAYAPLLYKIAQIGIDVYLIDMPDRLAIYGIDKADKIINKKPKCNWYMMGHSLGGAMASNYAYKNQNKIKGLILLWAYSTKDLSKSNLDILLIYGSNDKILNKEKYKECLKNYPKNHNEYIINGGNHAAFGNYGKQNKDGKLETTFSEQQAETIDKIYSMIYGK